MGRIKTLLASAFNVRPGEGLPLFLLLAHSFTDGIWLIFLETQASALFLGHFSVESLPYVYVLTALVSTALGYAYSRLESRLPRGRLLVCIVALISVTTTAFSVALFFSDSKWLVMALMVWREIAFILSGVEFWALAGFLFNVRQSKRLFALVGGGQVVSGVLGGFSVPAIVAALGTKSLLVISAVGTILSLGLLMAMSRVFKDRLSPVSEARKTEPEKAPLRTLWQQRYLVSFFIVSILSGLAFYFIDYLFFHSVEIAFTDEAKLAAFFGIYYAVLNGVELASSAFISGRLMTRYGLGFGLMALPFVDLATTGTTLFGEVVLGAAAVFVWTMIAGKLLDEVVRNSVQAHAFRVLYQPLPANKRLRIQAFRESVVEPMAMGVSGVLLVILTSVFSLGAVALVEIVIVILVAWAVSAMVLRREYTTTLVSAISRKGGRDLAISLDDRSTVELLKKGLTSDHPAEVIYCLRVLEANEHASLGASLVGLLGHADASVRKYVLERIEELKLAEARDAVIARLSTEASPDVKAEALRALCSVGEADVFEIASSYLSDPDPRVRKGAMVGLLRSGGIDGVLSAGDDLNRLLSSSNPEERALAAHVLGEVEIRNFFRPLLGLLADGEVAVRCASLTAAGKLKNRKLLPLILNNLGDAQTHEQAFAALLHYGADALPGLEERLEADAQPIEVRMRAAQLCGRIGGERALALLKRSMTCADRELRMAVLQSLVTAHYVASGAEVAEVKGLIRSEVDDAAQILAAIEDATEAHAHLRSALAEDLRRSRDRALTLLTFVCPADAIEQARVHLASTSAEKRAAALEVLDNVIPQEIKRTVFPLFDELTTEARFSRLSAEFPQQRLGTPERLVDIVARSGPRTSVWTKACALFAIAALPGQAGQGAELGRANPAKRARSRRDQATDRVLVGALAHPSPIVRETAAWTLHQANHALYRQHRGALRKDPHWTVVRTVARLDARLGADGDHLPGATTTRGGANP